MNLRMRSRTEPARWNEGGPLARGVGSRFWAGWRGLSTERWLGWGPAALFVLEGSLVGPWAAGGSVGPGRSSLTSCLSVLWGAAVSWGSGLAAVGGLVAVGGLAALGGLGGGLGLRRASTAGPWASTGSGGGSGEAVGGELSGEAGELDVLPGGTCSRSVTVVTSRLVTSGGGSGTSARCSRSSGSGASHRSSLRAACPLLSSLEPLWERPPHNLPAKVAASISWARTRRMAARISLRSSYSPAPRSSTVSSSTSFMDSSRPASCARAARCSASRC